MFEPLKFSRINCPFDGGNQGLNMFDFGGFVKQCYPIWGNFFTKPTKIYLFTQPIEYRGTPAKLTEYLSVSSSPPPTPRIPATGKKSANLANDVCKFPMRTMNAIGLEIWAIEIERD